MQIVFLTNFYNHHQAVFSESLSLLTQGKFVFLEMGLMRQERIDMGWAIKEKPSYVHYYHESQEKEKEYKNIIDNADVVIIGQAPLDLVKVRLKNKKLTFNYTERWYKKGINLYKQPYRALVRFIDEGHYKSFYMLCASAYTAYDCTISCSYRGRLFRWGYFPEEKTYPNFEELLNNKDTTEIIWCGRFIKAKHPELILELADYLKNNNINFKIKVIGTGYLENQLKKDMVSRNLNDKVSFLGAMKPDEVRHEMEKASIFICTSDFNEGWGAVVNEAMNSGCAVVASHAIGSVPFLIEDKINGLIYKNEDQNDLFKKVELLLKDPIKGKELGEKAYETICKEWNAKIAAKRFFEISQKILNKESVDNVFMSGPCSKALILKNGWYKNE